MGHNAPIWYESINIKVLYYFKFSTCYFDYPFPILPRDRPQVSLEQWSFLEKIFNKTKLEERTWAKLVNLDTLHWYCDGPMPTATAHRYGLQVRQRKPITPHFDFFLFTLFNSRHPSTLCRDGRCQEKGLHQVASCFEKTSGRPTFQGDGFV